MGITSEEYEEIYATVKQLEVTLAEHQVDLEAHQERIDAFERKFLARMKRRQEEESEEEEEDPTPTETMEEEEGAWDEPLPLEQFDWIDRTLDIECGEGKEEEIPHKEPKLGEGIENFYYNNIISTDSNEVMKIEGHMGGAPVTMLIDCGATHNFISPELVKNQSIRINRDVNFKVTLGTGVVYKGNGRCPAVAIKVKNLILCSEFYKLPLEHADIILGMKWLKTLGDTMINWKNQTMQFIVGEEVMHFQGNSMLQPTHGRHHQFQAWPTKTHRDGFDENTIREKATGDLGDKINFKGGGPDVSPTPHPKILLQSTRASQDCPACLSKGPGRRTPRMRTLGPHQFAQVHPGLTMAPTPCRHNPREVLAPDFSPRHKAAATSEGSSSQVPAQKPRPSLSDEPSEDPSEEPSEYSPASPSKEAGPAHP